MQIPALHLTDGYKVDHRRQYPENTVRVYSNFTPRKSRVKDNNHVVFFGITAFIKQVLIKEFSDTFFSLDKEQAVRKYKRRLDNYLGPNSMTYEHVEQLHDLGYLPVTIKALPEGSFVKMGVPVLTITNEIPEFFWVPNFLETILSCELWHPMTSATTIALYRKIFDKYARLTVGNTDFSSTFQIHDFSMRGHVNRMAAAASGAAHLLGSRGTDTIPAIDYLEEYYNANSDNELIGGSIPATEHSVMCMGMKDGEFSTFKRLITEIYPKGYVSIVSDTWDLWEVCKEGGILEQLKPEILARDGKVVPRPDSGDPVRILCGDVFETFKTIDEALEFYKDEVRNNDDNEYGDSESFCLDATFLAEVDGKYYEITADIESIKERGAYSDNSYYTMGKVTTTAKEITRTPEQIGVVELLWNTFGGTVNELGFKELDSHIGTIYGDSITFERAEQICQRLMDKGFASTNWVAGVGSYTYQYVTRDTYGMAMKATYGELAHRIINIIHEEDGSITGECPTYGDGGRFVIAGPEDRDLFEPDTIDEDTLSLIEPREIFKDPITDDGTKKSAKGLLAVYKDEKGEYYLKDQCTDEEETGGEFRVIFQEGELIIDPTLAEIRAEFETNLKRVA